MPNTEQFTVLVCDKCGKQMLPGATFLNVGEGIMPRQTTVRFSCPAHGYSNFSPAEVVPASRLEALKAENERLRGAIETHKAQVGTYGVPKPPLGLTGLINEELWEALAHWQEGRLALAADALEWALEVATGKRSEHHLLDWGAARKVLDDIREYLAHWQELREGEGHD